MVRTAVALVLLPLTAGAAWGTTVDFTQLVLGLDHKPVVECKEQDDKGKCVRSGPVSLGAVCAAALSLPDRDIPVDDQVKRARLAQKVVDGKSVDLTVEEAKMIKDQVGKLGVQPIVVLDVVKVIDPASVK